jgi:hypothetical protein
MWIEYIDAKKAPEEALRTRSPKAHWETNAEFVPWPENVFHLGAESFPDENGHGLYVAEAHTNGSHFKRGIGILLTRTVEGEEGYQGGRLPIEQVDPNGTLEAYMASLKTKKELDTYKLWGAPFYRAHAIESTGWPDFLFGENNRNLRDVPPPAKPPAAKLPR